MSAWIDAVSGRYVWGNRDGQSILSSRTVHWSGYLIDSWNSVFIHSPISMPYSTFAVSDTYPRFLSLLFRMWPHISLHFQCTICRLSSLALYLVNESKTLSIIYNPYMQMLKIGQACNTFFYVGGFRKLILMRRGKSKCHKYITL